MEKIPSVSQAFLSPLVRVRGREDVRRWDLIYAPLLIQLGGGLEGSL